MSKLALLAPLGLLGLLGIIALIIIYVLKPNYQQKIISSTYVWKLSLKYRKKRIPISRFRNIIIFICQILLLTSCAFILAQPVIEAEAEPVISEKVIVIDASASMLVSDGSETRFERAVEEVKDIINDTFDKEASGTVSVILAGEKAYFLGDTLGEEGITPDESGETANENRIVRRMTKEDQVYINDLMDELIVPTEFKCYYGSGDVEGGMSLAEQVLVDNPDAQVMFYTATEYIDKGNVTVVDVSMEGEWNAAILDVRTELVDNYYNITIEVGCYDKVEPHELTVTCELSDVNGVPDTKLTLTQQVQFNPLEPTATVEFKSNDAEESNRIFEYGSIYAYVTADDGLAIDNSFHLYGGKKEVLRVQYASALANNFFITVLNTLKNTLRDKWDLEIVQARRNSEFVLEGFDFYIFEHMMPEKMPTDGVVFLVNPDKAPEGCGFELGKHVTGVDPYKTTLGSGEEHPITHNIDPTKITVNQYTPLINSDGFIELMNLEGHPIMIAKNTVEEKVVALGLNLNYSNLPLLLDFPVMMFNIFEHYFPSTVSGYAFEVGEDITLNTRLREITLIHPAEAVIDNATFNPDDLPASVHLVFPGNYTVMQKKITYDTNFGTPIEKIIHTDFYVTIPNIESNIIKEIDALPNVYVMKKDVIDDLDLLIYLAAALVALLFIEWWLQAREYF